MQACREILRRFREMNFWKMKHPMEMPDTYTSARPKRLFNRPMVRRIKNSGRTLTCMGTKRFRERNREILSPSAKIVRWIFSIVLLLYTSITIFVIGITVMDSMKSTSRLWKYP